ncbi:MAG: Icc protein [Kiritimatiellia bacterium]|jgi:Icc protein
MKPSRRAFLGAGAAALAVPNILAAPKSGKPLRIGFYTDLHMRPEWGTPDAWQQAAEWINRQDVDFLICGGDAITDGFDAGADALEPRWDAYFSGHNRLNKDVYMALGNHDIVGAQPTDGSDPEDDPRRVFKSKFKLERTYYSFDALGHHVLVLDPFEIGWEGKAFRGWIDEAQQAWIREDLARVSASTPILIVSHMPFYSTYRQFTRGALEPMSNRYIVENNLDVLKLFARHRLVGVLSGHLHVNEFIKVNGLTHICGGAVCAKWWRGPWFGTQEGFGVVSLDDGNVGWEYIDYQWESRRPPDL